MCPKRGQPPKVTADQWSRAALAAIADSGLSGVSVEALARALGVTKGSFYGYFANREELIAAALEMWQADHEEHMLSPLRAVKDPVRRFELMAASTLLRTRDAFPAAGGDALAAEVSCVELSLMGDRRHPGVANALGRVVATRVDFLTECLAQIGHTPPRARQLAVSAYMLSLGAEVLRRNAPRIADEIDPAHTAAIIAPYLTPETDPALG